MPSGCAVSVGSPPPTSTISPGTEPATTVVCTRWSSGKVSNAAAVVRIFAVEDGTLGSAELVLHSTVPVSASVTEPAKPPRSGFDTTGASAAARPAALGDGASSGAGATAGNGRTGTGGSAMVSPPCRNSSLHGFRVTATPVPTASSTTSVVISPIHIRRRRREASPPMFLPTTLSAVSSRPPHPLGPDYPRSATVPPNDLARRRPSAR